MAKEFWIPNIGHFVKIKDEKEINYDEIDFEVLNDADFIQILPDQATELFKGTLVSKRLGRKEGRAEPEPTGTWEDLTPVKVIVAVGDMGRSGDFVSIYPLPCDIQFDI